MNDKTIKIWTCFKTEKVYRKVSGEIVKKIWIQQHWWNIWWNKYWYDKRTLAQNKCFELEWCFKKHQDQKH